MGFYLQSPELQVDLLAYHQLLTSQNEPVRLGLIGPLSLNGYCEAKILQSGGYKKQVSNKSSLRRSMMKQGANKSAVDYWLGDD